MSLNWGHGHFNEGLQAGAMYASLMWSSYTRAYMEQAGIESAVVDKEVSKFFAMVMERMKNADSREDILVYALKSGTIKLDQV